MTTENTLARLTENHRKAKWLTSDMCWGPHFVKTGRPSYEVGINVYAFFGFISLHFGSLHYAPSTFLIDYCINIKLFKFVGSLHAITPLMLSGISVILFFPLTYCTLA